MNDEGGGKRMCGEVEGRRGEGEMVRGMGSNQMY